MINALTNEHHPCQALADVMTLGEEFGTLAGIQVARRPSHSHLEVLLLATLIALVLLLVWGDRTVLSVLAG